MGFRLTLLAFLLQCSIAVGQVDTSKQLSLFRLRAEPVSRIDNPLAHSFLELVPEQREKIRAILTASKRQSKSILAEPSTDAAKLERLKAVRRKQDRDLRALLLPQQLKRVEILDDYMLLLKEGFAVSVVKGSIAAKLKLGIASRKAIRDQVVLSQKKYRDAVVLAQKKAIEEIISAVPEMERPRMKKLLEPMFEGDGQLWRINDGMLDLSRSSGVFVFPPLESIDDKN